MYVYKIIYICVCVSVLEAGHNNGPKTRPDPTRNHLTHDPVTRPNPAYSQ